MATPRRRNLRTSARGGVLAAVIMSMAIGAAGCSWSRLDESSSSDMRPVPTIPPTVAPGEEIASGSTIAIAPTGPITTEVIGDPRPDPDSEVTLPPLPDTPAIDACTRLADVQAVDALGAALGGVATAESLGDDGCRFTSGPAVAEVHFASEDTIEADWFRREAIEPVGDVTADAVGVVGFAAPGSSDEVGYTIALVSRRQGVVVAVRGTADDRSVAAQLANLVESTT
jgi:hypothetical protein